MKKLSLAIFSVVALVGLATAIVWAAPTRQGELPDLVLTDISWTPDTVFPGDEVTFEVKSEVQGTGEIAEGVMVTLKIAILTTTDDPPQEVGKFEGDRAADLIPGETLIVTATLQAPAEGSYHVVASLDTGKVIEEADKGNYERTEPFLVKSALPPGVSRLFAGLGMFAAVMAIVAVGTEVIIDTLRVLLGMKRKVTALEALDRLESKLPGQLAALGVGSPELKEFQGQVDRLREVLDRPLTLVEAKKNMEAGQFKAAYDKITAGWDISAKVIPVAELVQIAKPRLAQFVDALEPINEEDKKKIKEALDSMVDGLQTNNPDALVREVLEKLEKQSFDDIPSNVLNWVKAEINGQSSTLVNDMLQQGTEKLAEKTKDALDSQLRKVLTDLGLSPEFTESFIAKLDAFIEEKKKSIQQIQAEDIYNAVAELFQQDGPRVAAEWLERHANQLPTEGSQALLGLFDQKLKPVLADLGLNQDHIAKAQQELEKALGYLEAKAQAATSTYVASLKKLLLTVEERRNEMQSPFRKAWRTIRNSSFPVWAVLIGVGIGLLVWFLLSLILSQIGLGNVYFLMLKLVLAVVVGLILSAWIQSRFLDAAAQKVSESLHRNKSVTDMLANFVQESTMDAQMKRRTEVILALTEPAKPDSVAKEYGVSLSTVYRWACRFLQPGETSLRQRLGEAAILEGSEVRTLTIQQALPSWLNQDWQRECLLFSLGDFFSLFETVFNYLLRRASERGQVAQVIKDKIEALEPTNVAAILQEREDQQRDEEASRLRWLRAIAIVIGVILAYLLQVDAAVLLEAAVPGIAATINVFTIEGTVLQGKVWNMLPPNLDITPGIILTGLAASAGSAFWHDQLDRLQSAKKQAESAAKLVQQMKGMIGTEE